MASAHSGENHLASETTKVEGHHPQYDLESGGAGAPLGRQISVQLTAEQFEKLYLQPGGQAAKGDLSKRLGNPTALGVASFLICLTTFATELMGWAGATTNAAAPAIGAFYFVGGLGLTLAGIMEWIVGNTFPMTVFITFGGYWFAFAFLLQPSQGIAAALEGNTTPDYNRGVALYLVWWAVLVLIYLIASLRTNVVFVLLFIFLDITFWILIAAYLKLGNANLAQIPALLKAGGAFAFLTCCMGWYLLAALVFGSTGIPLAIPVGDLSGFLNGRRKTA